MKQTTTKSANSKTASNSSNKKETAASDTKAAVPGSGEEKSSLLEKFFITELKDIYYAENKIVQSLPKMQEASTTDELKEAFDDHLHQTQKHVKRLEKVFEIIGEKAEGKKCEAIEGIVKEAEEIIKETQQGSMTRDAALIMAAQKVEHYEIATYGGLVQLAITLGLHSAAEVLEKTLFEEEDTDKHLTDIAEMYINIEAEEEDKYTLKNKRKVIETA